MLNHPFSRPNGSLGYRCGIFLLLLALLLPPAFGKGEGIYEAVPLRKREVPMIETSNEYADRFLDRGYRYRDPEMEEILVGIGEQLHPEPTDSYVQYRFYLFRDPQANAFALPDGQVYINTGMLARLENEAQLAGLIGHEINHVAGHHGIVTFRSIRKKILTGMVLGPFTLGLSDIFLILAALGYSRDLEEEADRRALPRVLDIGYDVREVPELFEIINQDWEGVQPETATKWSTHPELQDRANYLREMIGRLPGPIDFESLRVEEESFQRRTRPIALMTVQDLIRKNFPRSAVVLARILVKRNEADPLGYLALGDALVALGPDRAYSPEESLTKKEKKLNVKERFRRTREERQADLLDTAEGRAHQERNLVAARKNFLIALDRNHSLAPAHRGLGEVSLILGEDRQAARSFMTFLRMEPGALDKQIILKKLQLITRRLRAGKQGGDDANENEE